MRAGRFLSLLLAAAAVLPGFSAQAQTTAASGTIIVLPIAASIPGAYATTVFVRNPNVNSITLNVRYYQADNASPPGDGNPLTCSQLTILGNRAVTFDLGSQCTFVGTGNFGQLVLEDVTRTYKINSFYAYSRSQESNGNGFSVEGFPVGNFSSSSSDVLGLKATAAAPHYRSNCYVGALGEPVNYQILLVQGENGVVLGSLTGSVGAYHQVRILDVFASAGLGPDQSNVRATFSNTSNDGAAFTGFCTLETSDNGSADFRIAKSSRANDERESRLICYAMDNCTDTHASITNPAQLSSGKRNIHWAIFDQPDFIKCDLVSDQLSALQIQLRGPTDTVQGTTPFTLPAPYNIAPYTAGGSGATGFYIYTGEKSTIDSGITTRWFIDVTASGAGSPTFPINYGIKCFSGNGISVPWFGRSV
ncbi:MAG: hypothetical protein ACHP91_09305 [Burkholderiales bacterium]